MTYPGCEYSSFKLLITLQVSHPSRDVKYKVICNNPGDLYGLTIDDDRGFWITATYSSNYQGQIYKGECSCDSQPACANY
mgnify:CR=1 FL=1